MDEINYIHEIERKLVNNEQLTPVELRSVIVALKESKKCFQKPYYEVIYHDECDNTETRIMNPVHSNTKAFNEDHDIRDDFFELHFRRFVRKENNETN